MIGRSMGVEPFLSIWLHPRAAIRKIVDTNPGAHVFPLICLAAFFTLLNQASARGVDDQVPLWAVFLVAAVLSPLAIPVLYLHGVVGRWAGSRLGGVASRKDVRAAAAWSTVPAIVWSLLVWPVRLTLFGDEAFRSATPGIEARQSVLLLALEIGGIAAAVWNLVLGITCFAEVHRFSAWRAIGAALLGFAVVIAVLFGIVLAAGVVAALI